MLGRVAVLFFGLFSYLVGVSSLLGWIACMLGLMPFQRGPLNYGNFPMELFAAIGLTVLFGVQHTLMARPHFKAALVKMIPPSTERSLYVLKTGVVLWFVLILWPSNAEVVWSIGDPTWNRVVYGLGIFGWVYLFAASFSINHFELFGLQQTFCFFMEKTSEQVPFKERLLYKFDRHPIMTGALIGMWAVPVMRLDHLMFSSLISLYIIVGVFFEERDLIHQWGEGYLAYKKRVKSIVPSFRHRL